MVVLAGSQFPGVPVWPTSSYNPFPLHTWPHFGTHDPFHILPHFVVYSSLYYSLNHTSWFDLKHCYYRALICGVRRDQLYVMLKLFHLSGTSAGIVSLPILTKPHWTYRTMHLISATSGQTRQDWVQNVRRNCLVPRWMPFSNASKSDRNKLNIESQPSNKTLDAVSLEFILHDSRRRLLGRWVWNGDYIHKYAAAM